MWSKWCSSMKVCIRVIAVSFKTKRKNRGLWGLHTSQAQGWQCCFLPRALLLSVPSCLCSFLLAGEAPAVGLGCCCLQAVIAPAMLQVTELGCLMWGLSVGSEDSAVTVCLQSHAAPGGSAAVSLPARAFGWHWAVHCLDPMGWWECIFVCVVGVFAPLCVLNLCPGCRAAHLEHSYVLPKWQLHAFQTRYIYIHTLVLSEMWCSWWGRAFADAFPGDKGEAAELCRLILSKTSQVDVGLSGGCWSSALREELTGRSSADRCLNPGADSSHFSSCTAVHCPALAWLQTGLCRWVMRALGAAVGASWDFISQ